MQSVPTSKQRALLDEFQSKAFDLYAPDVSRTSVALARYKIDKPVSSEEGIMDFHLGLLT